LAWITDVTVTSETSEAASTLQECEDAEQARELELERECELEKEGGFFGSCEGQYFEDAELCKISCSWECSDEVVLGDITCTQDWL
jgi:hypothetical protein